MTLRAMIRSQASSSISSRGPNTGLVAALFTSMSRRPKASVIGLEEPVDVLPAAEVGGNRERPAAERPDLRRPPARDPEASERPRPRRRPPGRAPGPRRGRCPGFRPSPPPRGRRGEIENPTRGHLGGPGAPAVNRAAPTGPPGAPGWRPRGVGNAPWRQARTPAWSPGSDLLKSRRGGRYNLASRQEGD